MNVFDKIKNKFIIRKNQKLFKSMKIKINYNSFFLFSQGFTICAVVLTKNNVPEIFVDYKFLNLSEMTQHYLLLHEYGHVVNNHFKMDGISCDAREKNVLEGRVSQSEIEADEYSISYIGIDNYINSINEIIGLFNPDDIGGIEFKMRRDIMMEKFGK